MLCIRSHITHAHEGNAIYEKKSARNDKARIKIAFYIKSGRFRNRVISINSNTNKFISSTLILHTSIRQHNALLPKNEQVLAP